MHIAHLNIRSLWPHFEEIKIFLHNSQLDCLTISESWLTNNLPSSMINIPHYQLFRLDRQHCNINNPNCPKVGGGLCVYVQDDITVDAISLNHLNISDENIELQCIKVTPKKTKQYTIFDLDRPPTGIVSEFLSNLDDRITEYVSLKNNENVCNGRF